jgi:hypothetical protein
MRFMSLLRWMFIIAFPCACLEMPLAKLEKTGNPVVNRDASADAPDPLAVCAACLAAPEEPGPGCRTTYTTCTDNEKCGVIIQCGFDAGCFLGSRRAFLACGLPCVSAAGVLLPDDPTLKLASNLFQCFSNGPCADICFTSD